MSTTEQLQLARESFRDFLRAEGDPPNWQESVLIAEGFYRGRRFRSENHSAIWMADRDSLAVSSADGRPIQQLQLVPASSTVRRAA